MSVKHVKEYYKQIYTDYKELLAEIPDLEEAVSQNLVFPDQLDAVKKQLEALKTNYARITYIMFLLDMPNKKDKQAKYIKLNKEKVDKIPYGDTLQGIRKENELVLNNFKNSIDEINKSE